MKALLLLAACAAIAAAVPPTDPTGPPAVDSMMVHLVAHDADTLLSTGTRIYVRNLQPGDTIRYQYWRNDTLLLTRRTIRTVDSVKVAAPGYGQAAVYRGAAQVERGGRLGQKFPTTPMGWSWSYTRGPAPVPPPIVDSVVRLTVRLVPLVPGGPFSLRPGQVVATDSNVVQVCVFGTMRSGRRVKLKNSWNAPRCEAAYRAWLAAELANPLTQT